MRHNVLSTQSAKTRLPDSAIPLLLSTLSGLDNHWQDNDDYFWRHRSDMTDVKDV